MAVEWGGVWWEQSFSLAIELFDKRCHTSRHQLNNFSLFLPVIVGVVGSVNPIDFEFMSGY